MSFWMPFWKYDLNILNDALQFDIDGVLFGDDWGPKLDYCLEYVFGVVLLNPGLHNFIV